MFRHALSCAVLGAAMTVAIGGCAAASTPPASTTGPVVTSSRADPTPGATRSPVAPPSPSVEDGNGSLGTASLDKRLAAGTYRVADPFGVPFEITLPANWQLKTLKEGDTEFATTLDGQSYPAWIVVDLIENVFADPCKSASGPIEPPVAADVGSIARALTRMAGYKAGPVADVEIGGHTGKSLTITNTIDTETAGCDSDKMLPMWTFRGGDGAATNGHARELLWVVDVDGTPVIIDAETFQDTPADLKNQIRSIAATVSFE